MNTNTIRVFLVCALRAWQFRNSDLTEEDILRIAQLSRTFYGWREFCTIAKKVITRRARREQGVDLLVFLPYWAQSPEARKAILRIALGAMFPVRPLP